MTNRNAFRVITLTLAIVLSIQVATAQESELINRAAASQSTDADGQTSTKYLRPELFVSGGGGISTRWSDDCCSPAWKNLGGGFNVRLSRRFGLEVEGNRMLGVEQVKVLGTWLQPDGTRSRYEALSGVSSLTLASGNILYYFSDKRIQPYVSAGIGGIWERGTSYFTTVINDYSYNDVAGTAGAGVRLSITPRISIRPDFRLYGTSRGGVLHTVNRASVAVAYQW